MADETNQQQGISININPTTTPVLYTDNIVMTINEDGVTLDVSQRIGSSRESQVVARIGMSRDHAKKFAAELSRILAMTQGASQTGKKGN